METPFCYTLQIELGPWIVTYHSPAMHLKQSHKWFAWKKLQDRLQLLKNNCGCKTWVYVPVPVGLISKQETALFLSLSSSVTGTP